ncbi:hypothetical protein ACFW17_23890 [Streptomyces sp. NPDC058961]|uniref:hypothetical protein n=1 Tax=Streptomyces sp. NPDC058961 TaxID=3346680 RepID=UPI003685EB94
MPDEAELGGRGDDQSDSPLGGLGIAEIRAGPAEYLLDQSGGALQIESPQERRPEQVISVSLAPVPDHHSQTGSGSAPWSRRSALSRITVPSMIGSVSGCVSQAA